MRGATPASLHAEAVAGSRRALARLLSDVEDGRASPKDFDTPEVAGRSLAITGPPGVGKSCLIDHMLRAWAGEGRRTALLAVDPSSSLSGGALLGDRIRLTSPDEPDLADRIYVRSIATRRATGSVPTVLGDLVRTLHLCGWEQVLIETVGAGQSEVRCAAVADRIVLIEGPARGDAVQAEKAGLLELADLILVNKSDLDGAARHAAELRDALSLDEGRPPEVCLVSAKTKEGLEEAMALLNDLPERAGSSRARARERLANAVERHLTGHDDYESMLAEIASGRRSVEEVMEVLWRG